MRDLLSGVVRNPVTWVVCVLVVGRMHPSVERVTRALEAAGVPAKPVELWSAVHGAS